MRVDSQYYLRKIPIIADGFTGAAAAAIGMYWMLHAIASSADAYFIEGFVWMVAVFAFYSAAGIAVGTILTSLWCGRRAVASAGLAALTAGLGYWVLTYTAPHFVGSGTVELF